MCPFIGKITSNIFFFPFVLLIISLLVSTFHYVKNISFCEFIHFPYCIVRIENKKVQIPSGLQTFFFKVEGPVHTKTIVNANDSKHKLFYAFRPSVHTKTMKTLTVNA